MPEGSENVNIGEPIAIVVENKEDIPAFANATKESLESDGAPAAPQQPAQTAQPAQPAAAPEPAAAAPQQPAQPATPEPAAQPAAAAPQASSDASRVFVSPLAKTILKNSGAKVDLSAIKGSGPNGRVVAADVLSALSVAPAAASTRAAPAAPAAAGASANYEDVAVTPMRKVISTRLTESKQSIPHYYVNQTCDVDELLKVGSPPFDDG